MTIAALHRLLDEIDTQGGPDAAREWRLELPEPEPPTGLSFSAIRAWARQAGIPCQPQGRPPQAVVDAWRAATTPTLQEGPEPMATTVAPAPALPVVDVRLKPPADVPELLTTSTLLRWAEDHPDPGVQDQGARAEAALSGLRKRYTADRELAAITSEAEQLEARLAELRSRKAELAPAKKKTSRAAPSYDAKAVRSWAAEHGVDCPSRGRVPKPVLDAWRASLPQAG